MSSKLLWKYAAMLLFYTNTCHTSLPKLGPMSLLATGNSIHFNAVKCTDLDSSFSHFSLCQLKPVNRTEKLLSLRLQFLKPPVNESKMEFSFWKRANGYKPFVINTTVDVCRYLDGKKNPAVDWIFESFVPYTNINHSCPYTTDFIVDSMPLTAIKLPSVFPYGEYRGDLKVKSYGVWRFMFSLYATISEHN